jgi:hypothetical protein
MRRGCYLALLITAAMALAVILLAGSTLGQTDPPASGDWTVADTTVVKDRSVTMRGDLLVTSTGDLTLDNVTLTFQLSSDGQYGITVESAGKLVVKDGDGLRATTSDASIITSNPPSRSYYFITSSGSTLRITNSVVERCGHTGVTGSTHLGLYVGATDALITGTDIRNGLYGIVVENGAVTVQDSTVMNCTYTGVVSTDSSLVLRGGALAHNGYDGVRVVRGTALVDGALIHTCRYGVAVRQGAVVTVANCTIHGNNEGVLLQIDPVVVISNSTIHTHQFNGVHAENQGTLRLVNARVRQSARSAVYAYNGIVMESQGSTYYSNTYGLRLSTDCRLTSSDDTMRGNSNSGVLLEQSSTLILDQSLLHSNGAGIKAEGGSTVTAWGTVVRDNYFEGYKLTASSLQLHDGVISNCSTGGVAPDATSTTDWEVHSGNSSALRACAATLIGDLTVHGDFDLTGATLTFKTGPGEHHGLVCDGGRQLWDNSTIKPSDIAQGLRLELQGSATGRAWFLTVQGAGWSEASPGTAGMRVAADFAFHRSTFAGGLWGAIVEADDVLFDDCYFTSDEMGAVTDGGKARFENCTFSSNTLDLQLDNGAEVDMINSTFTTANILSGGGTLRVHWIVHVRVRFPTGLPGSNALVTFDDGGGTEVFRGTADGQGWTRDILVLEYIETLTGKDSRTPHTLTATKGGATNQEVVTVDRALIITIELGDGDMPIIEVTSHSHGDHVKDPQLVLKGTASDAGSGIYRVQARIATQAWEDAVGTETWQWTRTLPGDGTYPISIKAVDFATNEAIVQFNITLDTRRPTIFIDVPPSPANNSQMGSPNVTLVGYVDDRNPTVTWGNVTAIMDGQDFEINVTLVDGENLIELIAKDLAGNEARLVWRLLADLEAPPLTILNPVDGRLYNSSEIELDGITQPGSKVYYRTLESGMSWALVIVTGTGSFRTLLQNLVQGENSLQVMVQDAVGNEGVLEMTIHLDTDPPQLVDLDPEHNAFVNTSTVSITGSFSEDLSRVEISSRPGEVNGSNFTILVPLDEGANLLSLKAIDRAGNAAFVNIRYYLDTELPGLDLRSFKFNASSGEYAPLFTNDPNYELVGQTDLGSEAFIDGWSCECNSEGVFSAPLELVDGPNTIEVKVVDLAGNTVSTTVTVVLDIEPPELYVRSPEDRYRTDEDFVYVIGNVSLGDEVTIDGRVVDLVDGAFDFKVKLESPVNRIDVIASDRAGNVVTETRLVFRERDTSGLTGVEALDTNCNSLLVVLFIAFVSVGIVMAAIHRSDYLLERRADKLREVFDEDRIELEKPHLEPTTGFLQYDSSSPTGRREEFVDTSEDSEFVSMDEFRRTMEENGDELDRT